MQNKKISKMPEVLLCKFIVLQIVSIISHHYKLLLRLYLDNKNNCS